MPLEQPKARLIKLSDLIIEGRERKDFGDVSGLAESIQAHGLIHPIVVEVQDTKFRLVAGERRVRAAILNRWTEIPALLREELGPLERRELELEENLQRKNFSWDEEVQIKLSIQELKEAIHGQSSRGRGKEGWTHEDLALSLDKSKRSVGMDLELASFMRDNPTEARELKQVPKTAAYRKMKAIKDAAAVKLTRTSTAQLQQLLNCDALEGTMALPDQSVDLILTDPPYGAENIEGAHLGGKQVLSLESDNLTAQTSRDLLSKLIPQFFRVLKPGKHIYIFFSPDHYEFLRRTLQSVGFTVPLYPLVWNKDANQIGFSGMNYMRSYEFIMFGYKQHTLGSAQNTPLVNAQRDILTHKTLSSQSRIHAFEKPASLLSQLLKQSSKEFDLVLDPFAGSASVLRVCKKLKRKAIGFELNENHFKLASKALQGELEDAQAG